MRTSLRRFPLALLLLLPAAPVSAQLTSGEFLYVHQVQRNNLPHAEIMRRQVNGATPTRVVGGCLATAQYCGYADPVVSPDARRVAFLHERVSQTACRAIWVAGIDGSNPRQVSTGCDHKTPAWSPDGRKIAYESGDAIYEIGICTSSLPVRSATRIAAGRSPSYSRDGRTMAFERSGDIWTRNLQSGAEVNLTRSSRRDSDPQWTKPGAPSDGIVYLSAGSSGSYVYTMLPDGTQKKRITEGATTKYGPDIALLPGAYLWAEHEKIMFQAGTGSPRQLVGAGRSASFGGATKASATCN